MSECDFYRVEVSQRGTKPARTFFIHSTSAEWAEHDVKSIWTDGDVEDESFWEVESEDEPPTSKDLFTTLLTTASDILEAYDVLMGADDGSVDLSDVLASLQKHCTEEDLASGVRWVFGDFETFEEFGNLHEQSPLYGLAKALNDAPDELFGGPITPSVCARWEPKIKDYCPVDATMTGGVDVWSWDIDGGLPDQNNPLPSEVNVLTRDPNGAFWVVNVLPWQKPDNQSNTEGF